MASSNRVERILRNVLSLSLASPVALALVGGCSSIDTDGFVPVACGADSQARYLVGLAPGVPADFIELREIDDGFGGTARIVESSGTKCASATDKPACVAAFDAATSMVGFRLGDCVDFCPTKILVVNTGDEVKVLDTTEAVKTWLAPADGPADAVFLAAIAGYSVRCNNHEEGGVRGSGSGIEVLATRYTKSCDPIERTLYVLGIDANGNVKEIEKEVIESDSGACIGRRPPGLVAKKARGASELGAYFASVAHLEAASVQAFEALADELVQNDAPPALVLAARAARRDEVRHARLMKKIAARHGGVAPAPEVTKRPPRSLEAIALDNAVEGCIRETFGALVGMWQSEASRDPAVRRVMRGIARDEARHASLSWAIHRWVRPRLDEDARARIDAAQKEALAALAVEASRGNAPSLVHFAGLPDANAGAALAAHFEQALGELAAA